MLDHVTIRVSDREASRRFYGTVPGAPTHVDEVFDEWKDFSLTEAVAEHPATRHLHVAFSVPSRPDVDAFWRRGVDAGYRSDGEHGPRPLYTPEYHGGFLLDPDGNSVEAAHRPGRTETGPQIDHLWLGVADLAASRRFPSRRTKRSPSSIASRLRRATGITARPVSGRSTTPATSEHSSSIPMGTTSRR